MKEPKPTVVGWLNQRQQDNNQPATGFYFDGRTLRVRQARFARLFSGSRQRLWMAALILLLIAGVELAYIGSSLWFLLAALALALSQVWLWYRWGLSNLPATPPAGLLSPIALDQVLAAELLPLVDETLTPARLWERSADQWGFRFVVNRSGLEPQAVLTNQPNDATAINAVWQEALTIAKQLGLESITSGAVTGALITTMPSAADHLARVGLDREELLNIVYWQYRLEKMIEKIQQKPLFGGLARDWAFGYTPVLNRFGNNLSRQVEAGGQFLNTQIHQPVIEQIAQALAQPTKNSVALVGETGAGKSTLIYGLAELLLSGQAPEAVAYDQVIGLNASVLISAAPGRGQLEALLLQLMSEVARAKNIVLFLDDAELFFSDEVGGVNLSNVLLPVLESGRIRFVLAMVPAQWQRLVAATPDLAGQLHYQVVAEPDQATTLRVLQDQALALESRTHLTFTYQAIREAYQLAERYIQHQAFPGKGLSVLESSLGFADGGVVTAHSIQAAIEASLGVKIAPAGAAERGKLLNLESELHQRMVNQDLAVRVISDALRRARAGVRNPERPVGSFLFLGPTGVGKTELSKALADTYFGGRDQLIRVDMTEFATAADVDRLLASAESTASFLTQIRSRPFSVVLLDEVEKAHPDILNLLLQLLEEGHLTDIGGRRASFKEAIIIATSNAGADEIRAQIEAGQSLEQFSPQFIDNLISRKQFLPELINRFDEVVLFRPLQPTELKQVVSLMINEVNATLATQKVGVELSDEAAGWLVTHGNDPRLGARPLRRMVQRTVENAVAKKLLDGSLKPGQRLHLEAADLEAAGQPSVGVQ